MRNNRKRFSVLTLFVAAVATWPAAAQFNNATHDARSGAMGGLFLPQGDRCQAAVTYRYGFLTSALADKGLQALWPTKRFGTVAAAYHHFGNTDYHEQQLGAAYLLRATEWLHVGVAARYLHVGTADAHYRPQQWLGADVLLQATPGGNTTLAALAGTRPWDPQQPWRMLAVVAYRPLPQLLTAVGAEREEQLRMRMGLEYCYHECCFVRTGFATNPMVFTFGLGLRQQRYSIDLAVEVHNTLGITPQTTLVLWL